MNVQTKLDVLLDNLDINCKHYDGNYCKCNSDDDINNIYVNCEGKIQECEIELVIMKRIDNYKSNQMYKKG